MVKVKCQQCGKTFFACPGKKRKFCSKKCSDANMRKFVSKDILEKLYWGEGLTIKEIGKKLPVCHEVVWKSMIHFNVPRRGKGETSILKPNLEMNKNLAYLIGAILGDGYIFDNGKGRYYIDINAGLSKKFAERCSNCLREMGLNPNMYLIKNHIKNGGSAYWRVVVFSKIFIKWLKKTGIKELDWLFNSDNVKIEFVRGFADAEGWTQKERHTIRVKAGNTDKKLIDFVYKLLSETGFHPIIYKWEPRRENRKTNYIVGLTRGKEAIALLEGMVKGKSILFQ